MTTFKPSIDSPSLKMATDNGFEDSFRGDRFPAHYGYAGITLTLCLFQVIHLIVSAMDAPKQMTVPFHTWKNLVISWTHALIVGTWDLMCFWLYGSAMVEDLIEHYNWFTYSMIVFSTGYFIYDFLDLARAGKLFAKWEIILHHWAVISMFFYDVITCRCIAYNAVALLAEVNSFFLHSRKLLQMKKTDFASPVYRMVCLLNLLSFPFCRFLPVFTIAYGMYVWGDRVTPLYYNLLFVSTFMMFVINCILFTRLMKSDVLRPWLSSGEGRHKKKHLQAVNNNINGSEHLNGATATADSNSFSTEKPKMN